MPLTRTSRRAPRRAMRKPVPRRTAKPLAKLAAKAAVRVAPKLAPPPQVLFRFCRPGWAVIVEKIPNAQGTRFVCPFCTVSHRVAGPVRGFRKIRRAQWVKLHRVQE